MYWLTRTGPDGRTNYLAQVDAGMSGTATFSDRALEPDTTYSYVVKAMDSFSGEIQKTAAASAHTPGWQNQDIGQVGAAGAVQRTGEVVSVTGSGADIAGNADAFQFVHQAWSGDGVLIVRVNSVAATADWAKAGIMFRGSLTSGARFVMAAATPAGNCAMLSRATTDGSSDVTISPFSGRPLWLKVSRRSNVFQASQSGDGITWTTLGSVTLDLPQTIYAGLAVTSHAEGVPCTAVFDGFNLSPTWEGSGGTVKDVRIAARSTFIDFSWTNNTTHGGPYLVIELSRDNFRTSTSKFATNYLIGTLDYLEPNTTYYVRVRPFFPDGMGLSSPIFTVTTLPAPPGEIPAPPTSLSAHAVSSSQVNLMWADNSTVETGFYIEGSKDGINYTYASDAVINSTGANATSFSVTSLAPDTKYFFRVRAVRQPRELGGRESYFSAPANIVTATTSLTPTGAPFNVISPWSITGNGGEFLKITGSAESASAYQWLRNGLALPNETAPDYTVMSLQPAQTGIYHLVFSGAGGSVTSDPAVVGLYSFVTVAGAAREVGTDIRHPNGNIYDQVLLEGAAAAVRADPGQVTRLSYVDLNDDIVQLEFSGEGTLSITLDNASGPAPAQKYNQPDVRYMKGHATIVIGRAAESSNVAIFTVGRANAVNTDLFRAGEVYDGVADVATLAILSRNGRFGSVFAGDAHFFATRSLTGIFAPNVQFGGSVTVSDITASDSATPMLMLGQAGEVRIAGGDLGQLNNQPVRAGMINRVQFVDGTASSGRLMPAQTIQGRLQQNGRDVTTTMTAGSAP